MKHPRSIWIRSPSWRGSSIKVRDLLSLRIKVEGWLCEAKIADRQPAQRVQIQIRTVTEEGAGGRKGRVREKEGSDRGAPIENQDHPNQVRGDGEEQNREIQRKLDVHLDFTQASSTKPRDCSRIWSPRSPFMKHNWRRKRSKYKSRWPPSNRKSKWWTISRGWRPKRSRKSRKQSSRRKK